jgi:hypothetical protein
MVTLYMNLLRVLDPSIGHQDQPSATEQMKFR